MRLLGISESMLKQFDVSSDEIKQYNVVREAMTRAEKPVSHCKVIEGGAQLPAYSCDPFLEDAFASCSKEWVDLCFVKGVTNVDLDDDKINQTLSRWKFYGMQMHPAKDKKQKPVIHTTA
eukprot:CCRYP_017124-RA/>CCRYP_017124-RA protein AED:0.40 eAED:0.40 QI:0/-1/0/1/-1/0/1/0/119